MSEPNEVIEIKYSHNSWRGAAYRTDRNGIRNQVGHLIVHLNEEDGRDVIEQTLIALLDQTRNEPESLRCRFYRAIEWIETHVLNHRPYWLCQWINGKTYDHCPGWVRIINKTDDEDDSTVVMNWDGSDE